MNTNHSNVTWVAQSKERPKVTFQGRANGRAKDILRGVKTKLVGFTASKKVKLGETFKVSLVGKDKKTLDAWTIKAKNRTVRPTKTTTARSAAPKARARTTAAKRPVAAKRKVSRTA